MPNLALTTSWAKHTCISLQHATFLVTKFNSYTVLSSGNFQRLAELLSSTNVSIRNFYLTKVHTTAWDERKPFFVTTPMSAELALLTTTMTSQSTFRWETPIRHIIPTAYNCIVPGDAYITGVGAFCKELGFWCYVEWHACVEQCTLRHLNKKSPQLISINSLE